MALTRITTGIVADNTLAVANIADNAVDATKIASNSILTRHIDDNQVTTDQIAANTIATANIADNAVDGTKIASNSILTRHIDDDQITGAQLADNIDIVGTLDVTGATTLDSTLGVAGVITCDGLITGNNEDISIGGILKGSDTTFQILTSTSDGSDSSRIRINGGGGTGDSRGAQLELQGNEHTFVGEAQLSAGDATAAFVGISAPNASGYITALTAGSERLRVASNGNVGISEHLISSAVPTDARLHVSGGASGSGELENLRLAHLNTTTTNDGPSVHFHGKYNNAAWPFGSIATGNIGGGFGSFMDINIHPGDGTQNAADVTAMRLAGAANHSLSDARVSALGKNYGATSTNTSNTTANEHPVFNIEGSKGARVASWVHGTDIGGSGATHNPAYSWYKFVMPGGYSDAGTSGFLEVTCYLTGKHASGAIVKQYKCMFVNAGGNATDDGGADGAYIDEVYAVTRDVGSYTTALTINWYYLNSGAGAAGATYFMKATTAAREPFFTVSATYTGGHGHAKAQPQYFSFLGTGVNNDHEPSNITELTIN